MFNDFKRDLIWLVKDSITFIKNPSKYNFAEVKYYFFQLYYDILFPFKSFIKGIKNLIRWFPVIWNDRDWDYFYIRKLLIVKLSNMEKYFNSDSCILLHNKKYARRIRVIKQLIEKCQEDNFHDNFSKFEEKYGKLDYYFTENDNITSTMNFDYSKISISEKEYDELMKEAINKDYAIEKKYNEAIWKLFMKYERSFWE